MLITSKLEIDLQQPGFKKVAYAVQSDSNTRALEISLFLGETAWEIPSGTTAAVSFRKMDLTSGLYDTLPDGSTKAVTFSGNTLTAILAPQVLTCAGKVDISIALYDTSLNRLGVFPVLLYVSTDPSAGKSISNNYYYLSTLAAVNEAIGDLKGLKTSTKESLVAAINELARGTVTEGQIQDAVNSYLEKNPVESTPIDSTLTKEGYAADAKATGEAIKKVSGSGIHIGPEPPTDPNVVLWIDTDEDVAQTFIKAPETAEVGQTIVVKAVDENGKPTEWESANLPSGDTVVTITSGTTEEDTTFFEFTDLPDCKSYVFSATIPKYATYSGVSVIVNDVLCLVGGNYFVHPGCNKEINIEIRHVGTTGLLISGNSAQLNSPNNHDPLVSGYVTTPNRAAKIEKLKIALSNSNSLILSGAVYRLEGIGVV